MTPEEFLKRTAALAAGAGLLVCIAAGCAGTGDGSGRPAGSPPGGPSAADSGAPGTVSDAVGKMASGDYGGAAALLGALIDRDTTSPRLYDLMGQCMAEAGYCGQAGTFFRKGLLLDSADISLLAHAAQAALSCGYTGEARGHYLALSRIRPGDVKTLIALARISMQESDYDGAVGALRNAAAADSTSVTVHYLLGSSLAAQKKPEEAIAELNLALWCQPGYLPAVRDLAWLYYQAGAYDEAAIRYREGLDLQPGSLPLTIGLANCYFKRAEYDRALPLYRAAESGPFLGTAVYQEGLCYYFTGKYDTARTFLERAALIDTANVGAHYNLGLALMNLDDYPAAIESFERAIRLSRSDIVTSSYDRIGVAHYERKKASSALAAFRRSVGENARNSRAWYDMGILYENLLDDRPKALECYRKVVAIEKPSDEEGSLRARARERIRALTSHTTTK